MAQGLGAPATLVIGLALVAPAALASTTGQTLLEAEGRLLVGTLGVPVGDPDPLLPVEDTGTPPVSQATHGFTVPDCERWLLVTVSARRENVSADKGELDPLAPALIDVAIHTENGSRVAGEFGSGNFSFASETAVPAGDYQLRVDHLIGPPVAYDATVEDPNGC